MPRTTEPRTGYPTSVRLPRLTLDRIAELRVLYNASTSTVITMAIDRMHTQETHPMKTETTKATVSNRVCEACGADCHHKKVWEQYGKRVICMACGPKGYTLREDGTVALVVREPA